VRPGNIATTADKTVPPAADPKVWADFLVGTLTAADQQGLMIPEISLGPAY
jgi:uncharacterized lipoprotein NlpE involved in copper resistance